MAPEKKKLSPAYKNMLSFISLTCSAVNHRCIKRIFHQETMHKKVGQTIGRFTFNAWNDEITGSTKKISLRVKMVKISHSEITEVVLAHFNIGNNVYKQQWRVLCTFLPNRCVGQLLDISTKNCILLTTIYLWLLIFWSVVYWSQF